MDIRIPAIIVTVAAVLFLIILKTVKILRVRKKPEKKEPEKKEPVEFYSSGSISTAREKGLPAGQREICRTEERTMLLSYTTLILKDTAHPLKKYRAELFRPVMIGRSRENTIILEDSSVSRRHLRIFRSGALVYAENLSQINVTLLNGKQLTEPKELVTGSRLKIGNQCFLVEID